MKRIVIYISDLNVGGAQNMVYELAKEIKGYEVVILVHSAKKNTFLEKKAEKELNVQYLGFDGKVTLSAVKASLKKLNELTPDIVHCHLGTVAFGILWCRKHNRKCVITAHTRPDMAFSKKNQLALKYGLSKGIVRLVAVSKENQSILIDHYKCKDVVCVNNGLDLKRYYSRPHSDFTFIHVARQDKNKNTAFILECFAEFLKRGNNALLYLLGDGEEHNNLIYQTQKLNIEPFVKFTGSVSNTEDYYAVSDCFLLASYREALPMTAVEAIASGLSIVTTNVGGMKDIVRSNGFLVAVDDKEEYVLAMEKAMKIDKEQLSKIDREIAKEFSSEKMAQGYEMIYHEITW
ncbi:MAG: glycosyltransferase [Ruminococcus sp.]|nr:glycosyltransferase [Ruminococcus sp.]